MPRGTRGTGFNNRRTSFNPFDQKFNTSGLSNDFFVDGSLGDSRYGDFGGYQDIFTPKKKETDTF